MTIKGGGGIGKAFMVGPLVGGTFFAATLTYLTYLLTKDYEKIMNILLNHLGPTVCPRGLDLPYIVKYYMKWVTTSWTYSILFQSQGLRMATQLGRNSIYTCRQKYSPLIRRLRNLNK